MDIQNKVNQMLNLDNRWDEKGLKRREQVVGTLSRLSGQPEQGESRNNATPQTAEGENKNTFNIYLNRDGSLVNPYLNYQKILDNPNVTGMAKKQITEATGLTETPKPQEQATSTATTTAASSAPAFGNRLGFISAKYETGGWNPGSVSSGAGDYGGVSYGIPQFSTTTGSAASFVNWLKKENPEIGNMFGDMKPGTAEFGNAWKQAAAKYGDDFGEYQTRYAYQTLVDPVLKKAKEATGIDYNRSPALRELIYSTAIQFGPGLAVSALGNVNANMSDEEIINASYDKKIANYKSFFSGSSSAVQESVKNRFANERNDVLSLLNQPSSSSSSSTTQQSGTSRSYSPGTRIANTGSYNNDAAKGQCVWYVRGRAKEKLGKSTSAMGNANEMYYNAPEKAKISASASNLRPNMIVSYKNGTSSAGAKYGHVIYIEDVVGDTVYYTEGGSGYYKNGTDGVVKTASRQQIMNGVNSNGARIGSNVIGFIDVNAL